MSTDEAASRRFWALVAVVAVLAVEVGFAMGFTWGMGQQAERDLVQLRAQRAQIERLLRHGP